MSLSAVLFCPVCCTPVDTDEVEGEQHFDCVSCGTNFTVDVKQSIVAAHGHVG